MANKKETAKNKYFYVLISKSNHIKIDSTLKKAVKRMRGAGIADHGVSQFECWIIKGVPGFAKRHIGNVDFVLESKHITHLDQEVKNFIKYVYKNVCKCD